MSINLTIQYQDFIPGESGQAATYETHTGQATIPGEGNIDTPQEAQDALAAARSYTRDDNFQIRPQLPAYNCRPLQINNLRDIIAGNHPAACTPVRNTDLPVVASLREYRLFCGDVDL